MRNGYRKMMLLLAAAMIVVTGCKSGQDTEEAATFGTLKEEFVDVYRMQTKSADIGGAVSTFLDMIPQEAEAYVCCDVHGTYEVNNWLLTVAKAADSGQMTTILYGNETDGAYSCYTALLLSMINEYQSNGMLRQYFPGEDIKACSKEKAIEACRPYAEACGYTDCEVTAYAAERDTLREIQQVGVGGKVQEFISAPGPDFEPVTCTELTALKNQMAGLDAAGEEYKALSREYSMLSYYQNKGAVTRDLVWEYDHEVLILTYQPRLGEYTMAEDTGLLTIIYSPLYGPVYVQGRVPEQAAETIREVSVITQEEAWNRMLEQKGYDAKTDLILKKMSLVYMPENDSMIPCWSIEFLKDEIWTRVFMNAESGEEEAG